VTVLKPIKSAEQRTIIHQYGDWYTHWWAVTIGTLAVDGWAVTLVQRRGGWAGPQPAQSHPRCTSATAYPSTAIVPTSHHSMWHYNCLCTLKG